MNYSELESKVRKMTAIKPVTEQRGSWKWQDAYRVTKFRAHLSQNGKVLWRSWSQSQKQSWPQMRREGWQPHQVGSLHNVGVPRKDAIRELGIGLVRSIEHRGWTFA